MRRFSVVAIAAIVAALVAYTCYWFYMASELRTGTLRWAEAARAGGRSLAWEEMAVDGYPLAFRISLRNAVLGGAQPLPYEVAVATLIGKARPWDLQRWRLTAPGGFKSVMPGGPETVTVDGLDGSLVLGKGTVVDLVGHGVSTAGLVSGLRADRIAVRLTLPEHPPQQHGDTAVATTIELDQATLPAAVPPFGSTIETLSLDGAFKGAVPSGPLHQALEAWRADGGTIELQQGTLRWGALSLTANGTVALDEALQPLAAFTATIENHNAIVDAAVANGGLKAANANAVKLVLGLLAKPGPDGKKRLTVPVSIQNERLYLGPAQIAVLPPITWK